MDDHDRLAHKVCEKLSDLMLGLRDPEFAGLNGGLGQLEKECTDALHEWEYGFPEQDCRDVI